MSQSSSPAFTPLTPQGAEILASWEAALARARPLALEAVTCGVSHDATPEALAGNAGWKYKDTKDGVEIFLKQVEGDPFVGTKGVGIVQASPDITHFTANHCLPLRMAVDPMLSEGRHIQRVDKRTDVIYSAYKLGWPIANREALVVMRWEPRADGSIFVFSTAVSHPCVPEPRDGYVRSSIPYCGLLFAPLGDGTLTRLTYAVLSSPNGNIPAALVNASAPTLPLLIAGIRRVLEAPDAAAAVEQRVMAHVELAQRFWTEAQRAGISTGAGNTNINTAGGAMTGDAIPGQLDPARCQESWSWDRLGEKGVARIPLAPILAASNIAVKNAANAASAGAAPTANKGGHGHAQESDDSEVSDDDEDEDEDDDQDDEGDDEHGTTRRPASASAPASAGAAGAASASGSAAFCTSLNQADYAVSIYPLPPSRYDALLAQSEADSWRAVTRNEDDGWKFVTELEGIKIYQKPGPPGKDVKLTKGVGRIVGSPETVRRVFACGETRSKWDEMYGEGRVVEQIDHNTVVSYASFKAPWPVASRDFCSLGRTLVDPKDGSILVYYGNYTHPAVPPVKKVVRGLVIFSATWIKPVPGAPELSDVVYAIGTDPCGSLPPSLVNAVNVKQPLCVAKIGKLIATNPAAVAQAKKLEMDKFNENITRFGAPNATVTGAAGAGAVEGVVSVAAGSPSAAAAAASAAKPDDAAAASGLDQSKYSISVAPLPANKFDVTLQSAHAEAWRAATRNEDDGWKFVTELEGIRIFQKKGPTGQDLNFTKGVGRINGSPETVRCVFACGEIRPVWDEMYGEGRVVERIDANTVVSYANFKAPWPVAGRDFCAIGRSMVLPDGAIFVYSTNFDHADAPPVKKLVRGVLLYTALLLRPVPGQPDKTDVVYAIGTDPCGSLPKSLVNAANIKQPLCMAKISKLIATNPAAVRTAIETEAEKFKTALQEAAAAAAAAADSAAAAAAAAGGSGAAGSGASASGLRQADYGISVDPLPPSPQYDAALEACEAEAWRAVTRNEDDGWKFVTELEGIKIYQKKGPVGQDLNFTKGVGRIAAPPETVRCMFASAEARPKWDEMYGDGRVVERVDANTVISWAYFTAPWPVSSRDFCSLGRSVVRPDGSIFVYSGNWDHPDAPKQKKFVRGRLLYNSLLLRPVDGQPNATDVIYAIGTDPCGSLPKSLVNAANIKQPLCISKIGKLIASNPAVAQEAVALERRKFESFRPSAAAAAGSASAGAGAAAPAGAVEGVSQEDYAISIAPTGPCKHDALLVTARAAAWRAANQNEDDGWKFVTELEGIKIYQKQGPPGSDGKTPLNYTKGVGRIPGDPETVRCMFAAGNTRPKWDDTYDSGRVVESIDTNTVIATAGFKAPWPVSGRDFCTLGRSELLPNKAIFVYFTNYVDPRVPVGKKFVRGILHVQALLISPATDLPAGAPPQSDIIYALGSDLCGSLPISLVNAANIKQPLCIARIGKLISTDPAAVRAAVAFERKQYATVLARTSGASGAGGAGAGDLIPGLRTVSWPATGEEDAAWHAPLRSFAARTTSDVLAAVRARAAAKGGLRALRARPAPTPAAAGTTVATVGEDFDPAALGYYALRLVRLGGSIAAVLGNGLAGAVGDTAGEPLYQLYCTMTVSTRFPAGVALDDQYVTSPGPVFAHMARAPAASAPAAAAAGAPTRGLCSPIAAPDTRFLITVYAKPTAAAAAAAASSGAAAALSPAALAGAAAAQTARPIRLGALRLSLGELMADAQVDGFTAESFAAAGELPVRRAWYALSGVPLEVDRAVLRHEILASQHTDASAAAGDAADAPKGLFVCVESTLALSRLAWALWEVEHGSRSYSAPRLPGAATNADDAATASIAAAAATGGAHPVAQWAARNGVTGAFNRAAAAAAASAAASAAVAPAGAAAGSAGAAGAGLMWDGWSRPQTAADAELIQSAVATARAMTGAGTLGDLGAADEPSLWLPILASAGAGDAAASQSGAAGGIVAATNVFIPEVFVFNVARFADACSGLLTVAAAVYSVLAWRNPSLSALVLVGVAAGAVYAPWLLITVAALLLLCGIVVSAAEDHFELSRAQLSASYYAADHRDIVLEGYATRLRALAPTVSPQSTALLTALQVGCGRAATALHRARALVTWDAGDDRTALAAAALALIAAIGIVSRAPALAAVVAWAIAVLWHTGAADAAAAAAGAAVRVARGLSALKRDAQMAHLLKMHAVNAAPELTLDLSK